MQPEKCPHDENRETVEKSKSTQYLMRFDNLPTSLGKGERDFNDSIINTKQYRRNIQGIFRDTIHKGSSPYL